jgi:two-component system OmpR family sensor kinase
MFSSLRARLWFSYAVLILTALLIVAAVLFMYLLQNPILYRQAISRLKAVETIVASRDVSEFGHDLSRRLENAARMFDVRIIQFSQDRRVLVDANSENLPELSFPQPGRLLRANPILRDTNGRAWLYTLTQLPDQTWLMVTVQRPRVSVLGFLTDEFLPPFIQGGVIALLLSLIMAYFIARWIADPLQEMVTVARNMPSEQIKPIVERGPHEVQDLTRAFNAMLARMQSSQRSQRHFIADVSHELKTPLTSIQGFAQAMLDGTADTPEARKQAAEVIYDESARMYRMVLNLLDLARLDAGTVDLKMSPVNMPALLNTIVEKLSPMANKVGVTVSVDAALDLPVLSADGDRLAQVFTNLVDNALKFTPAGGAIILRTEMMLGEMQVSVNDTGCGIPASALPHVFDRFYQADISRSKGRKHGAGLGLAIVQEIVRAHGGRISVRSTEGRGTTFVVNLPLTQSSATTIIRRRK